MTTDDQLNEWLPWLILCFLRGDLPATVEA